LISGTNNQISIVEREYWYNLYFFIFYNRR
jgi:hypothetical protein